MTAVWSLVSSAGLAFSSPNTQLVLVRLAITTSAEGVGSSASWTYDLQLPANGDDVTKYPYFDSPLPAPNLPGP